MTTWRRKGDLDGDLEGGRDHACALEREGKTETGHCAGRLPVPVQALDRAVNRAPASEAVKGARSGRPCDAEYCCVLSGCVAAAAPLRRDSGCGSISASVPCRRDGTGFWGGGKAGRDCDQRVQRCGGAGGGRQQRGDEEP